jgi:acyl-CoA reductase-like NAD-dependent aldehyde dehydrogenase
MTSVVSATDIPGRSPRATSLHLIDGKFVPSASGRTFKVVDPATEEVARIWTRDVSRVHRVVAAVRSDIVWVNTYGDMTNAVPFGAVKRAWS